MNQPCRIQRRRDRGWRLPLGTIYVGRPTRWGNPFRVGERIDRDSPLAPYIFVPGGWVGVFGVPFQSIRLSWPHQAVEAYAAWIIEQPPLMLTLDEIAGRDLACWCPLDQPCHADVLLDLANGRKS